MARFPSPLRSRHPGSRSAFAPMLNTIRTDRNPNKQLSTTDSAGRHALRTRSAGHAPPAMSAANGLYAPLMIDGDVRPPMYQMHRVRSVVVDFLEGGWNLSSSHPTTTRSSVSPRSLRCRQKDIRAKSHPGMLLGGIPKALTAHPLPQKTNCSQGCSVPGKG